MFHPRAPRVARSLAVAAFAWLPLAGTVRAEEAPAGHVHDNGIVLFAAADLAATQGAGADHDTGSVGTNLYADLLISEHRGALRLLAEALVSTRGDHEFERLQVGWTVSDETTLWLGRFHQPASAWNTSHHHGAFLQTAITRPWIERWEDEGGVLPQHLMGALLEDLQARGGEMNGREGTECVYHTLVLLEDLQASPARHCEWEGACGLCP